MVDTQDSTDPLRALGTAVAKLEEIGTDVAAVVPPAPPSDARAEAPLEQQLATVAYATITVVPESGPSEAETRDLMEAIRDRLAGLPAETGAQALVTGQTAVGVDISAWTRAVR